VVVLTRIFDLYPVKYASLSELAQAMGISVSQVYRVRVGKRKINQKFIVGAIQAFPEYRFGDLFYVAQDDRPVETSVTIPVQHHGSVVYTSHY
jgi:multidrug efflux pump subunit AcrA (membrane-fusion protein)